MADSSLRFWDPLLQVIQDGQVIPILGQDVLRTRIGEMERPLYGYLAERLAERLGVSAEDLASGSELNTVACRHHESRTLDDPREITDVYPHLRAAFEASELEPPEQLLKLAAIKPFKLFVTTTFDPLLRQAIDQVRFDGRERTEVLSYNPRSGSDLPCELEQLPGPTVFHLLGKLSSVPDEYAVTDEDTLEFMHALLSKSRRPARLFDELGRQQLLIIGSSFPDWLARFFIRAAGGVRPSTSRAKKIYVDRSVRDDPHLRGFLRNFSAGTVVYDQGDPIEFVAELHERWVERYGGDAAPAPLPTASESSADMEGGAIFLSYASEDRPAVERLRDALEGQGMDVWFDRDDLVSGDDFDRKIRRNIENCSLFVPVISSSTLTAERRFFRREWHLAEEVSRMAVATENFIIPVAIDGTKETEENIPEVLRRLQWTRLPNGECSDDFVSLMKTFYRRYHKAQEVS